MEKSYLQEIANELRFSPKLLREHTQEPIARTIEGFVILIDSEENPFVKDRYARDMVNLIKTREKMREYKIGIMYLSEIKKKNLMHELVGDMISNHPVRGRIARFMYPFCSENPQDF